MGEQNNPPKLWAALGQRLGLVIILTVVALLVGGVLVATHFVKEAREQGGTLAPGFVLRDQNGQLTSLAQFRGKVVVLAFIDPECTDLCPLTTQSMLEALKMLGPAAASQVQLLGINVNPEKTKVADVAAYTREHELQGRWRFLTGSPAQLKRIWHAYHVYVAKKKNSDDIIHEAIVFVINGDGYESDIYSTPMSYESVGDQARMLAKDISQQLPGQPATIALQQASQQQDGNPIKPTQVVKLTALGPNRQAVTLGGDHPHLLLFFAGWLGSEPALSKKLAVLDSYAAVAQKNKWPSPVAVDVLTTEPSAAEARKVITPIAATLHAPIVQDSTGRIADGYDVHDLPWIALSSPSGTVLWLHDGWLSASQIQRHVRAALTAK